MGVENLKTKIKKTLCRGTALYWRLIKSGLFDSDFYCEQNPDVHQSGLDPLVHFICSGAGERRNPTLLFDLTYYRRQLTETKETADNLLLHFIRKGAGDELNPHPLFHTWFYRKQCEEQGLSLNINPLAHFLSIGYKLNVSPHPLFDYPYFSAQVNDQIQGGNVLIAYLTTPELWEVAPHPLFDVRFYGQGNPQVAESGICPLLHYLTGENSLVADPHPLFQGKWYHKQFIEPKDLSRNPLVHYLLKGQYEGRNPFCQPAEKDHSLLFASVDSRGGASRDSDSLQENYLHTSDFGALPESIRKLLEKDSRPPSVPQASNGKGERIDLTSYMRKKREEILSADVIRGARQ
jgi:hypothetical protein